MVRKTKFGWLVLFVVTILICAEAKIIKRSIKLQSLISKSSMIFITKFDIGVGYGSFAIKYRKVKGEIQTDFDKVFLRAGLLRDDKYPQFKSSQSCKEREQLYDQVHELALTHVSYASNSFKVEEQISEHIWYLYVFDCESEFDKNELIGTLDLEITIYNNNSHFGEDENYLLLCYTLMVIAAVILSVKYFIPVVKNFRRKGLSWAEIFIYISFPLLFLSYFYRLLDLFMVYNYGEEVWFLVYIYTTLKYIVEGVLVTLIVSVAWGWSLVHLKHQNYYPIIGTIVAIINITAIILAISSDEIEEAHHQYDRLIGTLILIMRVIIFLLFLAGIMKILAESVGKRKVFIKKFGYFGGVYLIAWPFSVIFSEIFLPNYLHYEVVTVTEEVVYIIVNAYLCNLFAFPDTDYKRVSVNNYNDDDEILPDYIKKY